jgi:hypothetical protein
MQFKKPSKYYNPSASVIDGLDKILQYEKLNIEYGKKPSRGQLSSLQIKERANINKTKHDLVQRIFISATNLLYFFEFIAGNNLVHKVFEKDVMSLFGAKEAPEKFFKDANTFVMAELIDASILHRNFGPNSFRMSLLEYMQYTITQTISAMSITELNNEISTQIVGQDMSRALAWVKLFARNTSISRDKAIKTKSRVNLKRREKNNSVNKVRINQ